MASVLCETMLQSASAYLASSLLETEEMKDAEGLHLLHDSLLAECADESDAAALRCSLLRCDIVVEMRNALSRLGSAGEVLASGISKTPAPSQVRVEVRGSAGRRMTQGAFTIGTAPECDVQILGDSTVQPLQCLVIPVPGGVIVADAWSNGSTRVTWRWKNGMAGSPSTSTKHRDAFVVEHGERAVLSLGIRTTITLGPARSEMVKTVRKECPGADTCTLADHSHTTTTCGSSCSSTSLSSLDDCSGERKSKRMKLEYVTSNRSLFNSGTTL